MTPTATRTSEPCTGREGGWTDNVIRYDGTANRAELVDSGGTTRYTWDGIRVLKTEDNVGTLKQRQVHGESPSGIPSVGDIAVIESSAGDAYVPEANQVGTITKVLDSSASVANSYAYDAFGVARSASEAFSNPYRFAGKPLDADPDLYHFIARQYDSRLGRFASRDPLRTQAVVEYGYVESRPLVLRDVRGLQWEPDMGAETLAGDPWVGYVPKTHTWYNVDLVADRIAMALLPYCPDEPIMMSEVQCCTPESCRRQVQELSRAFAEVWKKVLTRHERKLRRPGCGEWQLELHDACETVVFQFAAQNEKCFQCVGLRKKPVLPFGLSVLGWSGEHNWLGIDCPPSWSTDKSVMDVYVDPWRSRGREMIEDVSSHPEIPDETPLP